MISNPFNKLKDPRRGKGKNAMTFPIPFAYLKDKFGLDFDDERFVEDENVAAVLEDALNISLPGNNRTTKIFKPISPYPDNIDRPAFDDDPLGASDTGAIVYCAYQDFWGRLGLALAILPPRPFKTQSDDKTAFGLHGYYDGDQDFHIHKLLYPTFDYRFNRLSGISVQPLTRADFIARDLFYAESLADTLFDQGIPELKKAFDSAHAKYVKNEAGIPQSKPPWDAYKKPFAPAQPQP